MCCGLRPFVDIAAGIRGLSRLYCAFSSRSVTPCVALNALSGGSCAGICLFSAGEGRSDRRIIRAAIIPATSRQVCRPRNPRYAPLSFCHGGQDGGFSRPMTGSSFRTSPGILQNYGQTPVTGSLPFMETSCGRGGQRSSTDRSAPGGVNPGFVLLVPDDGRVPVHRGMCFLDLLFHLQARQAGCGSGIQTA